MSLPARGGGAGGGGVCALGGSRLDLCYVAERMLALHLPARDAQAEAQAAHMLTNKHGEHVMVTATLYLYPYTYSIGLRDYFC